MKNMYNSPAPTALTTYVGRLLACCMILFGLTVSVVQAQTCSGPPASAGTVTASPASVCFGSSSTLAAAGASNDAGIVYQWYASGTAGGPYSPVASANDTVLSTGALGFTTYYVLSVKCSATGDSVLTSPVSVAVLPLSGVYSIGATADCVTFTSIASFAAAVGSAGVSGPVVLNVPAGYTETTPTGGIVLSQCGLASALRTSSTNTLTIQKSGSGTNPVITGATGVDSTDAIVWIEGMDYVTIDGINLQGSASSVFVEQHEYGYALVRCDGTDGAQNNTIKNCSISLNRNNIVSAGIFSGATNRNSVAVITSSSSGANSNNAFYSNTISNAYWGMYISGYNDQSAPYANYDQNNTIGAVGQGNTISAFGNSSAAATSVASGIYTEYNNGTQIRYNTIAGSGHTGTTTGIYFGLARWASVDITNNTLTATSAATSGAAHIYNIYVLGGTRRSRADAVTNTLNISNNTIQNCAVPSASAGRLWGIGVTTPTSDSLSAHTVTVNQNTYTGNTNSSTSVSDGFAMMFCVFQRAANQVNITNNTCTNNQLAGGAGAGNRMIVTGSPGNTPLWICNWNIANNTLSNNSVSAAGGLMTGIAMENYAGNSMLSGSITITGNTITGVTQTTASATGTFNGITCTANFNSVIGAASIPASITNNTVSNIVRTASTTGNFNGIISTGVPTVLTITGNQVINNSIGGTATGTTGTFTGITGPTVNGAFIPTVTISNNTVTGNTHNGTGTSTLLNAGAGVSMTVSNNVLGNHAKTTIPASTTNATINALTTASAEVTDYVISGNTIRNIRILGITGSSTGNTINGILANAANTTETIVNNTVDTLYAAGTASGYTVSIFGIRAPGNAAPRIMNGNRVGKLYNTGGNGIIRAIRSEAGSSVTMANNKVYDIYPGRPSSAASATSVSVGISVSSGSIHNVYNNIIGLDFSAIATPSYTGNNAIMGIEVANSTATHEVNLRFNTIRIFGGSPGSGGTFGNSGIAVTSATPPNVELSNNIVQNLLTGGGTSPGFAVAYRRATTLSTANYSERSDNNLFYAGTPGASNLIFFDGTNSDQTLAAYKLRAGALSPARDQASATENVTFLNTTSGTNATYLHINPAVATLVEGGGKPITGLTADYDGDLRSSIAPDIGADEGSFLSVRPSITSVSITPSTSQCTATSRLVTVVTSNGALPVTGVLLNYSFNGVPTGSIPMTAGAANTWTGTIPAATPSNANVTWNVLATDGTYNASYIGSGYQDAYLLAPPIIAVQPGVCIGSSVTLVANPAPSSPSTYCATTYTDGTGFGDYISLVQAASTTLNNPTAGAPTPYYTNFPATGATTGTFTAGVTSTLTVAGGTYGTCFIRGWIDYNHDGLFTAAESFGISGNVGALTSGNITFTIPSTAYNGPTRMRLRSSDTSPGATSAQACGAANSTYGETEDYTINITGGSDVVLPNNFVSSIWSDGSSTVSTSNPATFTPPASGTFTYSVLLTDVAGCTVTATSPAITVYALPSAPTGTPSVQCGTAIPKARVSGGFAYNWYLQASGGTPVQSSLADTLTSYTINTTTTFYVTSVDPNTSCESQRTAVLATVTQPDAISINASATFVCPGTSVNLSVSQTGNSNNYAFSWTGGGLSSNTGASVVAAPPLTGSNVYEVSAFESSTGCATTATITITGDNAPVAFNPVATPAALCLGSSVSLDAGFPGTTPTYCEPTQLGDPYITSVVFNTLNSAVPTPVAPYYTVFPATGSNTTTVVAGQSYTLQLASTGTTYPFSIISVWFDWNRDGVFDASEHVQPWLSGNSGSVTVTVPSTASSGFTGMRVRTRGSGNANGAGDACTAFGSGSAVDYAIIVNANPGATFAWTYNGSPIGSGNTLTHTPTASGSAQYALVVTGSNGCTTSFPTNAVTVNANPPAPSTTASSQCGAAVPTASVASNSGDPSPIYNWYTAASGGTPIQSSTSTTLTSYLVTNTTSLYVSETNAATGCEGPRAQVTVTVLQPDSVSTSVSSGPYCLGTSVTLSAVNTGTTNNYTYSWSSAAGSGISGSISGATVTVTPTAAGTYTYTLLAADGSCNYVSTQVVTISDLPSINSATASPAGSVCAGSTVTLTATTLSSGPQTEPTGYATSNASFTGDEEIFNVTIGSINNSSDCSTTAPGAGSSNQTYSNYTGSVAPTNLIAGETVAFAVNVSTCGGNYDSRVAIFIDYNRDGDFGDLGEDAALTSPVNGPHLASGTFTVPAGISAGLSRMRVVNVETFGAISPTGTYGWGETEDYLVNLQSYGSGTLSWSWSPGGLTGNSVTVNPTVSTTYTVTATNAGTCTSTATVTVNTLALPAAPSAVNNSRCGFGAANVSVTSNTGASTPLYVWYTQATGGTPIPSQTGSSLVGYNVSATTSFWVAEYDGACESPRTEVVQTVVQPDMVTATASDNALCLGESFTLSSVQTGSTNNYTLSWSASPDPGSGLPAGSSFTSQSITPTAAGSYTYTIDAVDGLCAYQSSVTVSVSVNPTQPNLGADQTVCQGTSLSFTVLDNTLIGGGIQSAASSSADDEIFNVSISGTSLNNSSTCATLAPGAGSLQNRYSNYTTSVAAATLVPGTTYTGSITIGQCSGGAYSCGYAIFIDYNRNGLFDLPDERVAAGPALTAAVTGTAFPFSINVPSVVAPGIARMRVVAVEGADGTTGGIAPNGPYNWGETEDYAVSLNYNPGASYQWSSIPAGFSSTSTTISTGPSTANTSYVVTVTNSAGCTTADTVVVNVITNPSVPTYSATADSVCISGTVTFAVTNIELGVSYQWESAPSASGPWTPVFGATATNFTTPNLAPVLGDSSAYFRVISSCGVNSTPSAAKAIYISRPSVNPVTDVTRCGAGQVTLTATGNGTLEWYDVPSGGSPLATGGTYVPTVLGTTAYYVGSAVGNCRTLARQVLNVTVLASPTITAVASPSTLCQGGSSTLTVSSSNANYTYVWDGTVSGSSQTVTPASTNTYTVQANDATTGCSAITNVTVTVNAIPVITSVGSTPALACPGQPFQLEAITVATGPQNEPQGYCADGGTTTTADEQIFGVSFATMNNLSQGETCGANYTDYTSTIPAVTVYAGNSYPFSVVTDECDGPTYYASGMSIFIDYNRDGDWDDAGEQAYTTNTTTLAPYTQNGTITIPANASIGVTRMRVKAHESVSAPAPCTGFSYGEVEDYLVNITGPAATFSWSPAATLNNASVANPTSSGITASTTFTVTATSLAGCTSAPATVTVGLASAPSPVITTPDTNLCNSEIYVQVADNGPYAGIGYPAGTVFTWKDASGGTYFSAVDADSISSLFGNSFFVTVNVPGGCIGTSDTAYVVTKAVTVVENITNASCAGGDGRIIANISSGTAPFNYVWSTDAAGLNVVRNVTTSATADTLKNLNAGTYYLVVTDEVGAPASCGSGLLTFSISGSSAITASVTGTNITCNGAGDGTATVSYTGGAGTISILWNDGSTDASRVIAAGGTYTVIVSDNFGCGDTSSISITEPAALTASISSTNASAPGATDGSASVVVGGGTAPISIEWYDENLSPAGIGSSVTGLGAGLYYILITDANNCQLIETVTITDVNDITFNITAIFEGFYDGAGGMVPALLNAGVGTSLTETDTVLVELRDALSPTTVVASATAVISTAGEAQLTFPGSVGGNSYYIAVFHRNAVQTWSALPVAMVNNGSYDFTTASSQAYFDNMVEVSSGVWAFFGGDVSPQDEVVDILDQGNVDNDSFNFVGGYVATDINGDGVVDILDQGIGDNNAFNFVGSAHP